jgi:hypothetical protein
MVALVVMLATILHAWQRGTGLRLFFLLLTLTMVSKAGWSLAQVVLIFIKKLTVQQAIQNFSQKDPAATVKPT